MKSVFICIFFFAVAIGLVGAEEIKANLRSLQSTADDDGALSSNNDFVTESDVSWDTLTNPIIPRLKSSQRMSFNSLAYFGVSAIKADALTTGLPPFEDAFNPLNIKMGDLKKWEITPTASTGTSANHIVVQVLSFFSDSSRKGALYLGKQTGSSAEVAAIISFAATMTIGQAILSEIALACGTSCDNAKGLSTWWNSAGQRNVKDANAGLVL